MASEVPGPRQCSCGPHGVVVTIKQDRDTVNTVQGPVRGPERPSLFYFRLLVNKKNAKDAF